jgi:hypothetical protein
MLGGEIREVRDTMGVRIKVTIAGIRRIRESSSIGGFDGGRAMRSECTLRVDGGLAMHGECAFRVRARLRGWKFGSVKYVGKYPGVVSTHERGVGKYPGVVSTRERVGSVLVPCDARLQEVEGGCESRAACEVRFLAGPSDEGANARELGGTLGTDSLSLLNSLDGTRTIDRSSRPRDVNTRCEGAGNSAAPARRSRGLRVGPRLEPKPLEGAMGDHETATGEDGGPKCGRRGLDGGGNHGERSV